MSKFLFSDFKRKKSLCIVSFFYAISTNHYPYSNFLKYLLQKTVIEVLTEKGKLKSIRAFIMWCCKVAVK